MPELPEVETIARELCAGLCGRRITAVALRRPASLANAAPALSRKAFREQVAGRTVARVWRRAKILLMDLAAVGEEGRLPALSSRGSQSGNGETAPERCSSKTAAAGESSAADPVSLGGSRADFGDDAGIPCPWEERGTPSQSPAAVVDSLAAGPTSAADAPARDVLHLAVRLGMSGKLWMAAPGAEPEKHTHVIFDLDGTGGHGREPDCGIRLFFIDPRTFGSMRAVPGGRLVDWPAFAALGPEPLEVGPEEFAACFADRSGKMKALLLDQNVIAGVGNIYADESLFRAGISPEARADKVTDARLRRLHAALQEVLREAIAENGSSIRDYRDAHGDSGAFQNAFRAYGRHGQPCLTCGTKLTKTVVAGRTTSYCRKCQK